LASVSRSRHCHWLGIDIGVHVEDELEHVPHVFRIRAALKLVGDGGNLDKQHPRERFVQVPRRIPTLLIAGTLTTRT
jgi:hypothetical protein